jgi:hypothetical protein
VEIQAVQGTGPSSRSPRRFKSVTSGAFRPQNRVEAFTTPARLTPRSNASRWTARTNPEGMNGPPLVAMDPGHLVARQRPDLERRGLDQLGDPAGEPHPGRPVRGHLERASIGQDARPSIDRPHRARIGRGEWRQLEAVGMTSQHEVLAQPELTLGDADVVARPLEELHHERCGVLEPGAVREIRTRVCVNLFQPSPATSRAFGPRITGAADSFRVSALPFAGTLHGRSRVPRR